MDLVEIPRNPIPTGATTGTCRAAGGIELRYARWFTTGPARRGTICLFGGRGEFIEKYFETIADLRRRGFAVACMDWRGQGGSTRLLPDRWKGHVEDFADFEQDLGIFMKEIVLPDCPPPFFALGHSMGGSILLRAARYRDCWFDRIVVTSPLLRLASWPYSLSTGTAILDIATFFGMGDAFILGGSRRPWETVAFENNVLTSDRRRFERNKAILETAPDLGLGSPTIGWLRAAMDSMRLLNDYAYPASVHVPVLMLAAGRDRVVSSPAVERLAVQLKSGAHIVLGGAEHEILQERDSVREQVWAVVESFFRAREAA